MKTKSTLYRLRPQPKKGKAPSGQTHSHNQSQRSSSQLQRTIKERQRLKAAEHSAKEPVKKHLKNRGNLVGRRIANLQRNQEKNRGR
jgi:hypothetical protein